MFPFCDFQKGTKPQLGSDVCFKYLAEATPGFTGADLGGLVREASLQALKQSLRDCVEKPPKAECVSGQAMEDVLSVKKIHFLAALLNMKPSVTEEVS